MERERESEGAFSLIFGLFMLNRFGSSIQNGIEPVVQLSGAAEEQIRSLSYSEPVSCTWGIFFWAFGEFLQLPMLR